MSLLIQCQNLSKSLGGKNLFHDLSLNISKRDKLAIIGPNGAGKSTLLKIICKELQADSGIVTHQKNLNFYLLSQQVSFSQESAFSELERLLQSLETPPKNSQILIETALSKVGFSDFNTKIATLSGGWKKRLQIAAALAINPDILILDEPTNHLDLESIQWLENFLKREVQSYLIVSHDRYFLDRSCEKTIEINPLYPDGYFFSPFSYTEFLDKKALFLQELEKQEASLKSRSKRELVFLKSNPKARTTKSQARVRKAQEILSTLSRLKDKRAKNSQKIQLEIDSKDKRSKVLIKLFHAEKSYGSNKLFSFEDFKITDGLRLGILGPNGCGKSTFIKCLLETEPLSSGSLKKRDDLSVAYLSQNRKELDESLLLKEALSPKGEFALFQGQSMHVVRLGQIFGFDKYQLEQRVSSLSGGEKAKILLARAMEQLSDVFILDEPTNDIDISTLETLEESLITFKGAIIFVTHDRYFLDNVSNQILTFHKGQLHFFTHYQQYEDWQQQKEKQKKQQEVKVVKKRVQKLNNQERKELRALPKEIEKLEAKIHKLHQDMEKASLEQKIEELNALSLQNEEAESNLHKLYERWEELENQQDA